MKEELHVIYGYLIQNSTGCEHSPELGGCFAPPNEHRSSLHAPPSHNI